jgi:hypothetical protein
MLIGVLSLFVLALQEFAGGQNLIPDWQFNGSETSWTYHTGGLSTDLRLESVEWTDGRLVRVATCTEKHHTGTHVQEVHLEF